MAASYDKLVFQFNNDEAVIPVKKQHLMEDDRLLCAYLVLFMLTISCGLVAGSDL